MTDKQPSTKLPAYKVTISGSYRSGKMGEYVDFQGVTGYIPMVSPELAESNIRGRYAAMWITNDEKYPVRLSSVREVYIDELTPSEAEFTYVGKDIRELTYEELQDLATAKSLRGIPLYKKGGLRQAQILAYGEYSEKVLRNKVNVKDSEFNLQTAPKIVVDGDTKSFAPKALTLEESIKKESEPEQPKSKSRLSIDDLKAAAKQKGLTLNGDETAEQIHKMVFPS